MTKLILGIGIPGSGKTTALKAFAEKYEYEYICADDVRLELGVSPDNPLIASNNSLTYWIWNEIRDKMKNALKQSKTVVVDATFASLDLRKEFIELARENGAEKVQGVFLDTPSEIARERSDGRGRKIPEEVFNERVKKIKENPPSIKDGFDAVFTIKEYEDLFKAETINRERKMPYRKPLGLS